MAYEDYTVKQFENAMFKDDRSVMDETTFNIVYTEYVDAAKLYEIEEFTKVSRIQYLNNRINTLTIAIKLQKEFLEDFNIPFLSGFKIFLDNGHSLFWKNDAAAFLKLLHRVEVLEKKYISETENAIKDLDDFRKKKGTIEQSSKVRRESFIKTINSLNKIGYKIDKTITTVEELALMIKQQTEESKK